MGKFNQDTRVSKQNDNEYSAVISDRWNIGEIPNGGYLLALTANALRQSLSRQDPLTITGHYLRPGKPGPAQVFTEVLREGGQISTGAARLVQNGRECLRVTGSFGDLAAAEGPTLIQERAPVMPSPDECVALPKNLPIHDCIDLRYVPERAHFALGKREGKPEPVGYIGFEDDEPASVLALLLFADAFPPTVFNYFGPVGWVPTVELTVHIRQQPAPGYLTGRFSTRYLINGLMEEDGELWDSEGNLVALSRQLAKFRIADNSR